VEARPLRYPGLRAIFSKAGEEADDVIVRQVAARPLTVPVLVASSDAWVRDHSEAEGARVIAATTLLKVLRR
jgi:predicted RNA-binding protein with PIN domain